MKCRPSHPNTIHVPSALLAVFFSRGGGGRSTYTVHHQLGVLHQSNRYCRTRRCYAVIHSGNNCRGKNTPINTEPYFFAPRSKPSNLNYDTNYAVTSLQNKVLNGQPKPRRETTSTKAQNLPSKCLSGQTLTGDSKLILLQMLKYSRDSQNC